ncbi:hypothetical protein Tco_0233862 [Tanacetum coccineum]
MQSRCGLDHVPNSIGRRSKQDIINTVGTMGLKGLETSWNNSTAKVHEGTDEVLEGTAQEYESTAGANLSTAEVYESTAHSLFKMRVLIIPFSRRFIDLQLIMCGGMARLQRKFELRGRFCFILGDDYISTSGEALAL